MRTLAADNWEKTIQNANMPVFIMHYSPNCSHCKNLFPYFNQYANEFKGKILFGQINIVDNMQVAKKYRIMGTPTFTFFCQGKLISKQVGELYPSLIKKLIEDGLKYGKECAEKTTWIDHTINGYA